MITRLAISGYRSLRDVRLALGRLNIVTGANGSGKSSLYAPLAAAGGHRPGPDHPSPWPPRAACTRRFGPGPRRFRAR